MMVVVAVCFSPSVGLAVDVDDNKEIGADDPTVTAQQNLTDTDSITLTNSGTIQYNGSAAVKTQFNRTGITIINNAGARIAATDATRDYAIKGQQQINFTITNSGTIEASQII